MENSQQATSLIPSTDSGKYRVISEIINQEILQSDSPTLSERDDLSSDSERSLNRGKGSTSLTNPKKRRLLSEASVHQENPMKLQSDSKTLSKSDETLSNSERSLNHGKGCISPTKPKKRRVLPEAPLQQENPGIPQPTPNTLSESEDPSRGLEHSRNESKSKC